MGVDGNAWGLEVWGYNDNLVMAKQLESSLL